MVTIAALYGALLGLLYILLSARVIRRRRATHVPLGSANSPALERAVRVHANFAEYVPLTLLLLALAELGGTLAWLLHLVGLSLLLGRSAHAYGVSQAEEDYRFRVVGMALTLGAIGVAASLCFWVWWSHAA